MADQNSYERLPAGLDRQALLEQMPDQPDLPGASESGMSGNTGINGGEIPGTSIVPTPGNPTTELPPPPAEKPAWLTSTEHVNLPGWDNQRTDLDPKMVFGRYAQSKGGHLTGQDIRDFVKQDPRWELGGKTEGDDPLLRVKQAELDKWAPNKGRSVWQDVIGDSGPGGANTAAFFNAAGDPSQGFAAPEAPQAAMGGDLSPGFGDNVDTSGEFFADLMRQLQGSANAPSRLDSKAVKALMGG